MKVSVCIPCGDLLHASMMSSYVLAERFLWAAAEALELEQVTLRMRRSTLLPMLRQDLAEEALAGGATHIVFIDSDMTFPAQSIGQLLARDRPIVACNYPRRRPPHTPTAARISESGEPEILEQVAPGLVEVSFAGFGLVAIRAEVFEALERPWFDMVWRGGREGDGEGGRKWHGEDAYFCDAARSAGYPVLVDVELSGEVGHLGEQEFRL